MATSKNLESFTDTASSNTPVLFVPQWKLVLSAMLGNGLEFYDFALFGVFSVHFSLLFFPEGDMTALLKSLSIFAVGFLSRPLGSFFFGYFGDSYGRKKALAFSIILMGVATCGIGCLPTYKQTGLLAPILLLSLRLLQGFCLGGENNGSAIFLLEHLKKQKGLAGGLILTGGAIGTLLATFLGALFTQKGIIESGWRIPFLLGLGISFAGFYIRHRLEETPEFKNLQRTQRTFFPLKEILSQHLKPFLCTIVVGGLNGVFSYTLVVYINIYLNQVAHFSLSQSLFQTCIGIFLFGCFAPLIAAWSDKIGYAKMMRKTTLLNVFGGVIVFYLLSQGSFLLFLCAIFLTVLMVSGFNGPTNAFLNTLFPPEVRYTGIALGYALGIALFGGTTLIIYTFLIDVTQSVLSPALYFGGVSLLGYITLKKYDLKR